MCIRDRITGTKWIDLNGNRRRDADEPGLAGVTVYVDFNNNCLLYTSDAADDLLCVDLGGRRIIKKKK